MSAKQQPANTDHTAMYVLVAYLLAALTMALWSGNWVLGRAMRADIPPVALAFWRWGSAAIVLAPFAYAPVRREWPQIRKHWRRIAGLGITGAALFHSFVYTGLRSTEVINGVLLNALGPITIILIAWLAVGDRITRRQVAGIAIAFAGTVFLVARGDMQRLLALEVNSGDIWILIAMIFWGVYNLFLRDRPKGIGGITLLFLTAVVAVIALSPAYAIEYAYGNRMTLSWQVFASIAYIGVFATVLAYTCYNASAARIGPSQTGIILYLLPVLGSIAGMVFLDEQPRSYHFIGFAVILAGILLATSKRNKKVKNEVP